MESRIEVQEYTFQSISREIHDNVSLSLTLAKLYLNTFTWNDKEKAVIQLESSINILTHSISKLNDISKSLDSDVISSQGLITALRNEMERIRRAELFTIDFRISGEEVYLDTQRELILFRIIQEAFNNIIKHSQANQTHLTLNYTATHLHVGITDNGKGFLTENPSPVKTKAGLKNMGARANIIGADIHIESVLGFGTSIRLNIPIKLS